ncbi:DUF1552 domain-containing protein [Alienimonas chondri]|uniref:DUF1552 domain-containing protein n=1 Tax=Alienimonas chondri TaxID=2681879 RepID=A0ABX1VAE0_9PLAN|nr:DUF1552 domain-containing protein [Alienimonas chondri]NNJ25062.1 hypothetical protein [Alienimonas chondri]
MFNLNRHAPLSSLSRRTLLRGAGAALALPLLDAMPLAGTAEAADGAAKGPIRLGFTFFPNGCNTDRWFPKTEGAGWELTPTLEPLKALRGDVTVLSGLDQHNAQSLGDGGGDHARNAATYLTGVHPLKSSSDIRAGRSVDQVAADRIGSQTRLPSLELGIDRGRNAGSCDSGYSCAYSNNISWRSPSQPTSKEINPKLAFQRLFGSGGDAVERRLADRKSVLDLVADDAASLTKRVGTTDRRKLDEYFTSVRDVERRIERTLSAPPIEAPEIELPSGVPNELNEHLRLMYDLQALAFQADVTRVTTFMVASAGSNRNYPEVDVKDGHHHLSHHQSNERKLEQIARIDRFLMEHFARFVQKLKETPDGEGNLLDNSLILYGSAIRDGNRHSHADLPLILAGRGGGAVKPGQHRRFGDGTPLNNLFLTMLDAAGATGVEEFGDSTGRVTGLDA